MSKRAVILAGGQGVRLRPYTLTLPKPLMPLGDHPILEIIIKQLAQHGIDHLTLAVNHQAEIIQQYFQDGSRWGVRIDYSLEQAPMGTLGPLSLIPDLPAHFLVMNADILTDFPFSACWDEHLQQERRLTIGAYLRKQFSDYGIVHLDESGCMTRFEEKPVRNEWVSMGVYMLSREVLEMVPKEKKLGFDYLVQQLLQLGTAPAVFQHEGHWLDIGSPADYWQASKTFAHKKREFLYDERPIFLPS